MKEKGVRIASDLNIDGMWRANEKYREILKLDKMLDNAGIYHELIRYWDG